MDSFDYMTNKFFVPYRLITGGNFLTIDQKKRKLYNKETSKYEQCSITPINEHIYLVNVNHVWQSVTKNTRSKPIKKGMNKVIIQPVPLNTVTIQPAKLEIVHDIHRDSN